jgi:hypothetical protein
MLFDCPSHCDAMQAFPNYVANPSFLSNVRWGQEGYSHMLKNMIDKDDAVAIVVGKVINDRLSCGPTGNWLINFVLFWVNPTKKFLRKSLTSRSKLWGNCNHILHPLPTTCILSWARAKNFRL